MADLAVIGAGSYVMAVTPGTSCGDLCSAYLTDATGRRRDVLLHALGGWVNDLAYAGLPVGNGVVLSPSVSFGFFTQGIYASVRPCSTGLLPVRIRATRRSFGRNVGALPVTAVSLLARVVPVRQATGLISLCGDARAIPATQPPTEAHR